MPNPGIPAAAPDAPIVAVDRSPSVDDSYGSGFDHGDFHYDDNRFDNGLELVNPQVGQPWELYLGRVEMGLGFFRKLWEGQWVMQGWDEIRGLMLLDTRFTSTSGTASPSVTAPPLPATTHASTTPSTPRKSTTSTLPSLATPSVKQPPPPSSSFTI
ncbi:hypothetical protein JCM1840_007211 [Sporobolomyces johnsonii]